VVRPANLTLGVYRGGRRPIDLYWRIHVGIPGSNMPANYPALNSEQIWDVVNFLQVLPYRSELEKYHIELDQPSGAGTGH
jgi:mono/diheme cytochrome c family protein